MLIDGNSLTYRAFFALPTDMATASGQVTNAVFGFTSMLINLMRDHQPDRIAVSFDLPKPTFRHERIPTYKAGRKETPDILRQQMGLVRQVIETLDIPIIEAEGFEADDILATLATEGRDAGHEVIVVSGDRDVYQLVEDPGIKVLYNKRGVSDYALYDEAGILDRTGVAPSDYVIYAAMRGDKSDNLPGVAGVGEKTAAKLVNKYKSVDGIFEAVDEQTPKLRENLSEAEEQVRLNAEVMVLLRDVPLDVGVDDLTPGEVDADELRKLFDFLEFRTLYDRLAEVLDADLGAPASNTEVLEAEWAAIETVDEAVALLEAEANGEGLLSVAPAWVGAKEGVQLEGLALVTNADLGEVAWLAEGVVNAAGTIKAMQALFSSSRGLAGHNTKPLVRYFFGKGIGVNDLALDTQLGAYLLDPAESRYELDELLQRYAQFEMPTDTAAAEGQLDLDGTATEVGQIASRQALAVAKLAGPMLEALDAQGLRSLNDEIEVPLVKVLAKMEHLGVGVDVARLTELRDELSSEAERLRGLVVEDAGVDFNVNSTKQLREVLFENLGLTPQKKTKTGYSTDAQTLEKMRGEHPIVDHLLEYREVEKLRSTYGEGLLAEVGEGDRIRATFNQTVARTGRLSSDQPNLHNIPVRSETGRVFREAFVAGAGYELLVADYNQIELRCIAHLAEDPGLISAFEAGDDIHTATASRVFAVAPEDVTTEYRSKAKMVSYGLAYGMEAYGLGQRLNIPTGEAAEILDAYFEAFPAVKQYMDDTVAEARERGYTETLFGRRRQIPELASSNFRIRQAGERQAMNAGIQGLAADIFKVALVNLDKALESKELASRVILQVHDEVILEVPPAEMDEVHQLTIDVMGEAFDLRVPLEVNISTGHSWADAK